LGDKPPLQLRVAEVYRESFPDLNGGPQQMPATQFQKRSLREIQPGGLITTR
jgi:hypothetical protein